MIRKSTDQPAPAGAVSPARHCAAVVGIALALVTLAMTPASALVVMNHDPLGYIDQSGTYVEGRNYVAPTQATNPGVWGANVDPGWANATTRGVYLGNGWVLSATHTGSGANGGKETINGEDFTTVRNSGRNLRNPTALRNAGVAEFTDVRLFRVNSLTQFDGTPEQRAAAQGIQFQPIRLATAPLATDQSVVIIGNGQSRPDGSPLLHADKSTAESAAWPTFTNCNNCFHTLASNQFHAVAYDNQGPDRQAWGTNKVESPTAVTDTYRLQNYSLKGGSYVLEKTAVQVFDFDEYSFTTDVTGSVNGGGGNEAQGANRDSGSGVYAWNEGLQQWELGGVMHSTASTTGANALRAAALRQGTNPLGDLTIFTDISVYRTQIEAYMAPPIGYQWTGEGEDTRFFQMVGRRITYNAAGGLVVTDGQWGDVNLDGVVSGDGTGTWAADDVTAFIQGWGHQQAAGDIFSWKRGDLSQDGKVDLNDFLLLRAGVHQTNGTLLSFSALFGNSSQVVPEPTTAMLLASAGLGLIAWRKLARPH